MPPNLTLLPLPPYWPELNPAEMLWRQMCQSHLSNRVMPDAESLEHTVSAAWLKLTDYTEQLRRPTYLDWIREAVEGATAAPKTS